MSAIWEIARNEALQHIRTKRLVVIGALTLLSLMLLTIVLPSTLFGLNDVDVSDEFGDQTDVSLQNFAFLFFLNASIVGGYLLVQLLAMVLTADGISSEWQRKTLFLVLSKPVSRTAFVVGKFIGGVVPLLILYVVLFTLDYLVMIALYSGTPSPEQFGRFFGAVGILLLGATSFAAMALFFSTLLRSSAGSMVWTLLVGILVFPIVGAIGDFTLGGDERDGPVEDPDAFRYDWSHYVSPGHVMTKAGDVLLGEDIGLGLSLIPTNPPASTLGAILAGFVQILVFLGGALLVVNLRNFE
ncbi:MAG: ABC transporter permease [Thermoplasmatota archaeon]